jgi:hypothetical protein
MYINELQRKLGLKPNLKAYTLHAPLEYEDYLPSPTPIVNSGELHDDTDWIQAFYFNKTELEAEISTLRHCLAKNGQLWISWPKKSSKLAFDLTDGVVRQIGLTAGLVDVKVASINDTWSGLKFVYRLSDRKL